MLYVTIFIVEFVEMSQDRTTEKHKSCLLRLSFIMSNIVTTTEYELHA